jgi:hypothetical protein
MSVQRNIAPCTIFYVVGETLSDAKNAYLWLLLQQKVGLKSIDGRFLHH